MKNKAKVGEKAYIYIPYINIRRGNKQTNLRK
jgi:hypothetical protein